MGDFEKDFDFVEQILSRDYSTRWKPGLGPDYSKRASRSPLSPQRSLGSVIKLLTPAEDYTDDYNAWLKSIPDNIFPIVYLIKAINMTQGDGDWRSLFGVDSINGRPGHELKGMGRRLAGSYLRVGVLPSHGWRTFKLRQDFSPAVKIQTEDDITASAVVPASQLKNLPAGSSTDSFKFSENCEFRLFQRPDDAIFPGLDRQTELDMSRPDNFLSNYEPLSPEKTQALVDRITEFDPIHSTDAGHVVECGGNGIRRLLGLPAARRRQAEQESSLFADSSGPAAPRSAIRGRTRPEARSWDRGQRSTSNSSWGGADRPAKQSSRS